MVGVVLGNEVLDALPVHRVRRRGDRLRELVVDLGPQETLIETEIDPTTQALAERLAAEGIDLVDGQTAEVCLALDDWIAAAVAPLRHGVLLVIDYGAPAAELYDPVRRRDGTLAGLCPAPGPRRPVPARRAAGPDGPCRRDRG